MKVKIYVFGLLCSMILTVSCNRFLYGPPYEQKLYEYEFEKFEPYLSIDSVYKTAEEKHRFELLKSKFIELAFDTSTCYYKHEFEGSWAIRHYYIDNILHNPTYDSLVVLLVLDKAIFDDNGDIRTYGKKRTPYSKVEATIIKVVIHKSGEWEFVCNPGIYGHAGSPYSEEMLFTTRRSLKRSIIRGSYFKKDLTPDFTFWSRVFNNPSIFFPDPYNDGFPLN